MEEAYKKNSIFGPNFELIFGNNVYELRKFLFSCSEARYFQYSRVTHSYLAKFCSCRDESNHSKLCKVKINESSILVGEVTRSLKVVEEHTNSFPYVYIFDLEYQESLSEKLPIKSKSDKKTLMKNLIESMQGLFNLELIHPVLILNSIFVSESLKVSIIGFENCVKNDYFSQNSIESIINVQQKKIRAPELNNSGYNIGKYLNTWDLGIILLKIFQVYKNLDFLLTTSENFQAALQEAVSRSDKICDKFKSIFKLMLMADPVMRPNPKTLAKLIDGNFTKVAPAESKLYTYPLTSKIIYHDSVGIRTDLVLELIQRIREDPSRDAKMLKCLNDFKYINIIQIIRALFLFHKVCFDLDSGFLSREARRTVLLIYNYSVEEKQLNDYREEKFREIATAYKNVLIVKFDLFESLSLRPNCSLDFEVTVVYKDFYNYLKHLLKLVKIVLFLSGRDLLFKDILRLLILEIFLMSKYFLNSREMIPKDISKKFLRFRSMLSIVLQKVYRIYNILDFDFNPPQAVYLGSRNFTRDLKLINTYQIKNLNIVQYGATCYLVRGEYKSNPVALKVLTESETSLFYYKREVKLLEKLKHENVVKFYGSFKTDDKISELGKLDVSKKKSVIMLEFCDGGTLTSLIKSKFFTITNKQQLKIASDIARGMRYLHSLGTPVIHRDLKPDNILIREKVRFETDSPVALIADFGHSKQNDYTMTQDCGTRIYMAPEVFRTNSYDKQCDVYSYGIILYVLYARKLYEPKQEFYMNKVCDEAYRPDLNQLDNWVPDIVKEIIIKCWDQNPSLRPSFEEIEALLDGLR